MILRKECAKYLQENNQGGNNDNQSLRWNLKNRCIPFIRCILQIPLQ